MLNLLNENRRISSMDLSALTWLWTTLLILILGFVFYRYLTSSCSYWEERGVVHEPANSLFTTFYNIIAKDMGDMEMERYKKYGRVYGMFEGLAPVLCVADPDLIRNILVKDFPAFPNRRNIGIDNPIFDKMVSTLEGDTWKRVRSIISPTFSTGKIKRMTDIIVNSAKTLGRNFATKDGKSIDIKNFYEMFTMDVIASVAFATKIHSYHDPNNRFIQQAKKLFPSGITWKLILFLTLPQKLSKWLRLSPFDMDVVQFFKEETLKIIEYRKKSGTTRNDFLQLLMEVEEETRDMENKKGKNEEISKNVDDFNAEELGHEETNAQLFKIQKNMKFLSQDELIAQCVLFFIAGYVATSVALTLATYLLAVNPEVQDKLREEIDEVTFKHDEKLTYAGVQEMEYLDRVISETLRIHPPATRLERIAGADYKLGDTGIVVEKGKLIGIPINAIHRDPEFYPDPDKFNPDRFTTEGKASRHPYSYLAFGAGPRNCVAMRFALMEVKLCIAFLVSQFIIKPTSETKVPLSVPSSLNTLNPKGIMLKFEKRKNRIFDGLQEDDESGD